MHKELAPKEGERASPDGLAIRSNKAWRELASEALDARDSARAANVELGMTYANHLCAFHIGDTAGMTLMGSPFASARDMVAAAGRASNKGEADAIRHFVGAAIRLHSEAVTALASSRDATEALHAANATIAQLRTERNAERDAAQARANNAETALAKDRGERAEMVNKINSQYAELEALRGALGVLSRFAESA